MWKFMSAYRIKLHLLLFVIFIVQLTLTVHADNSGSKTLQAVFIQDNVSIDGSLREPFWDNVLPATHFIQKELVEGE
ncbi:unnamed protein product, partial [marine sediment metagenome]